MWGIPNVFPSILCPFVQANILVKTFIRTINIVLAKSETSIHTMIMPCIVSRWKTGQTVDISTSESQKVLIFLAFRRNLISSFCLICLIRECNLSYTSPRRVIVKLQEAHEFTRVVSRFPPVLRLNVSVHKPQWKITVLVSFCRHNMSKLCYFLREFKLSH